MYICMYICTELLRLFPRVGFLAVRSCATLHVLTLLIASPQCKSATPALVFSGVLNGAMAVEASLLQFPPSAKHHVPGALMGLCFAVDYVRRIFCLVDEPKPTEIYLALLYPVTTMLYRLQITEMAFQRWLFKNFCYLQKKDGRRTCSQSLMI